MMWIKRLCSFFLALVVILSFSSCTHKNHAVANVVFSNEKYSIIESDGAYYLEFQDSYKESGALSSENLTAMIPPSFDSVEEMNEAILTGNFSEDELRAISKFPVSEDGTRILCALNRLYEPKLPAGWNCSRVFLYGLTYNCEITREKEIGSFRCYSAEGYAGAFDKQYVRHFDEMSQMYGNLVLYRATDSERNAEVFCYICSSGTYTLVQYTYNLSGKTLHIEETWRGASPYVREHYDQAASIQTSPSVWSINIWGEEAGGYFKFSTYFSVPLDEVPSDEWLQAFGLKPYVETESE